MVYLPPAFTEKRPEVLLEHIEGYEFGLLVSQCGATLAAGGPNGTVASHCEVVYGRPFGSSC